MNEFCAVNVSLVNDVWVKQMVFRKGDIAQTHAHTHDHQTLLAVGRLRVTTDQEVRVYQAPAILLITKGTHHRMEALEDGTVAYCIHALREGDTLVEGVPNEALHALA